jgi:hypothetical protein
MINSAPRLLIAVVTVSCLSTTQLLLAQDGRSDDEKTWYDLLPAQSVRVEPQKLELLSIQVSKLPRNTFGSAKLPWGDNNARSFVAASGTGIYGVFELDREGDLKYLEKLSSLKKFTDDSGKDLTENPGEKDINEFFDANKSLSVRLSQDHSRAVFTVRGYSTPTSGAKSLKADARVAFLSLSQEKSETQKIDGLKAGQSLKVGPVAFKIRKAGKTALFRFGRTVNPSFGNKKREWALQMQPRQKPVKKIDLLDASGEVVKTLTGMVFDGKSHTYYLEKLDFQPKSLRVTWYEKWELITVPLKIETPLGI